MIVNGINININLVIKDGYGEELAEKIMQMLYKDKNIHSCNLDLGKMIHTKSFTRCKSLTKMCRDFKMELPRL